MDDDDIQSKQAYLRENVLEKGYDADDFMSFLQMKKGENGLDLSNWTMKELTKAVNEFIKEKDDQEEENAIQNKIEELDEEYVIPQDEKSSEGKDSINNNNINLNENNNNMVEILSNLNDDIGKCQISENSPISTSKDSIKIKLSSPQKIDGGIFSKSFILYSVLTEPFGYKTNKRYNDFSTLRKILSIIYSNCVLPPLCKKNFGDRFSDALIAKRMRSIEKFMQGIIDHPLVKNSELINDFLSEEKKEEYNRKIKNYQKIKKPPSYVRQLKTLDGQIKIGIDKEKEIYLDNIKNYAQSNSHLLQKITKSYKLLMNLMQQLVDKMKDISQLWKLVLDKSLKYYDSHNTSETFNIMSKFMENWAEIQKNQLVIMNENIREYFRYVKNEFISLKEMASKVKDCKSHYYKAQEKLLNLKESLFQKQDIELWHLREEDKANRIQLLNNKNLAFSKMLPQDTMKVYEYKSFYGGMLNSLISEFERIRKINAKRHKENITKFIRLLSNECTNLHVCLADRLSEFNELKDDYDTNNIDGGITLNKVENLVENPIEENEINTNIGHDFENIDNIDEEGDKHKEKSKDENKKEKNKINENKKEDVKDENKIIENKKDEKNNEKNKTEDDKKEDNVKEKDIKNNDKKEEKKKDKKEKDNKKDKKDKKDKKGKK